MACECLVSRIKYGEPEVFCKLDVEKAYDYWESLLYLLRRCGLEEKWLSWIAHCISSVLFFVSANRKPFGFFSRSRGLRQGNCLLPFSICYRYGGLK
jgi:hypothetical protein